MLLVSFELNCITGCIICCPGLILQLELWLVNNIFHGKICLNSAFPPTKLISSSLNTSEYDCRKGFTLNSIIQIMCHRVTTQISGLSVKMDIFYSSCVILHRKPNVTNNFADNTKVAVKSLHSFVF